MRQAKPGTVDEQNSHLLAKTGKVAMVDSEHSIGLLEMEPIAAAITTQQALVQYSHDTKTEWNMSLQMLAEFSQG